MSVVRITSSQKNASAVNIQSCIYGIECELLEAKDPAKILFELVGSEDKIKRIVAKTNATFVSVADKVRI